MKADPARRARGTPRADEVRGTRVRTARTVPSGRESTAGAATAAGRRRPRRARPQASMETRRARRPTTASRTARLKGRSTAPCVGGGGEAGHLHQDPDGVGRGREARGPKLHGHLVGGPGEDAQRGLSRGAVEAAAVFGAHRLGLVHGRGLALAGWGRLTGGGRAAARGRTGARQRSGRLALAFLLTAAWRGPGDGGDGAVEGRHRRGVDVLETVVVARPVHAGRCRSTSRRPPSETSRDRGSVTV